MYRGTNFDADLTDRIVEAIETPGLRCSTSGAFARPTSCLPTSSEKRSLEETQTRSSLGTGVLERREVAEYATAYRREAAKRGPSRWLEPRLLESEFVSKTAGALSVARHGFGRRKGPVRSAVGRRSCHPIGLHATQSDDYPITVKTGHSIAELIFSPDPIDFTGIDSPDLMVILSEDGLAKAGPY